MVVATQPVDFRKGHDGLAAVVQKQLGLDPHSGVAVVFRSKRGDRIKVLYWDGSGIVLTYNRLTRASRKGGDPFDYLKSSLERIARGRSHDRIEELLPWNFKPSSA